MILGIAVMLIIASTSFTVGLALRDCRKLLEYKEEHRIQRRQLAVSSFVVKGIRRNLDDESNFDNDDGITFSN